MNIYKQVSHPLVSNVKYTGDIMLQVCFVQRICVPYCHSICIKLYKPFNALYTYTFLTIFLWPHFSCVTQRWILLFSYCLFNSPHHCFCHCIFTSQTCRPLFIS